MNGTYESFYSNGQIKLSCNYIEGVLNGKYEEFYENGFARATAYFDKGEIRSEANRFDENKNEILKLIIDDFGNGTFVKYQNNKRFLEGYFTNGFRDKTWNYYTAKGQIERSEEFNDYSIFQSKILKIQSDTTKSTKIGMKFPEAPKEIFFTDYSLDKSNLDDFPDVEAEFKGGLIEFYRYISENLEYPENALNLNITGKVYLSFVVNQDGTITQLEFENGNEIFKECSIKLLSNMPRWNPGMTAGIPVRTRCRLPLNYSLD